MAAAARASTARAPGSRRPRAVAARAASTLVAPRGADLRRLLRGVAPLLAEHGFPGDAHPAASVDLDDLDENLLPLVDLVPHLVDPVLGDLRDVQEPLDAREDLDERAEVDDAHDLAEVGLPQLGLGGQLLDDVHRLAGGGLVGGRDVHAAVVVHLDLAP